ncbi:MAG: FtsH protease activity modulator HflK [Devosia sp.]
MPWDNNTGGGGRNNNSGGPWGQAPGGGGPRRGGGTPNLEEILNRGRDSFRGGVPGGRWVIGGVAAALVVLWLFNSIYTIAPQEMGVETTFGVPGNDLETQGLHFLWWPFQAVERVNVTQNKTDIGTVNSRSANANEGMMLTSDQNIVDARYSVFWTITDPKAFLFNVREPADMVRAISESAMREVVGRSSATDIFRAQRAGVETEVQRVIEAVAATYALGVSIDQVRIEQVAPPEEVADAFAEVQRAQQDLTKYQEQARADANTLLGGARGQAAKIRQEAAAYKSQVVQNAEGEAARFISVYNEYAKSPEVTRRRLYLETIEQVLGNSSKVIVEPGASGSGVVPYLPLPSLQPKGVTALPQDTPSGASVTATPAAGG